MTESISYSCKAVSREQQAGEFAYCCLQAPVTLQGGVKLLITQGWLPSPTLLATARSKLDTGKQADSQVTTQAHGSGQWG